MNTNKKALMKLVSFVIILALCAGMAVPLAYADEGISVSINGRQLSFDGQGPIIVKGRTLVPVRGVFEALGFSVNWSGETRTATISKGTDIITITIGNAFFTINGAQRPLDVPAQVVKGRTLIPIRLPLESVDHSFQWNSSSRTVEVFSPPIALSRQTSQITLSNPVNSSLSDWSVSYSSGASYIDEGGTFTLRYTGDYLHSEGFLYWYQELSFSNDLMSPPQYGGGLYGQNGAEVYTTVQLNKMGTTTLEIYSDDPFESSPATLFSITMTAEPVTMIYASADQNGISIPNRAFLSQDDITQLLPYARANTATRAAPHPKRAMTETELQAWIANYNRMGGVNSFELEVLYLTNAVRAEQGLQPLHFCPYLSMAARLHTQLMADHDFFGHQDPFYGGPGDRRALFLDGFGAAENTAYGYWSPQSVIDGWMGSPGHRSNMLREGGYIGIGSTGSYATQMFT